MAKTPKTVTDFLSDLRTQLTPGGAKEVEHLKKLKEEELKARGLEKTNDGQYYLWDHRFYDRMVREREYSIDENEVANYFPLSSTIAGMLRIFEELLGFVFVELDQEARGKLSGKSAAESL